MVRIGVVGLGKMGVSHLAILNSHPEVQVAAVCDATGYILDVLTKYTGLAVFGDVSQMIAEAELDAVVIATPSRYHGPMVEQALRAGLHVFCEKPFCLDPAESDRLAALAAQLGRVNQVGYHYRFVGAFQELKRVLASGALGRITHVLAEAYGPVVLRPKGGTWRTQRQEGGGCLYDYAAHPIDLLNWCFGPPLTVSGSSLQKVFSRDTDDEVYSTLLYPDGVSAQISVNWSDDSYRKMSTKLTVWGSQGRVYADRQECQTYLRSAAAAPSGYRDGWNVRYTTDLTEEVWYYLRGEEYSAQLDHFVRCVQDQRPETQCSFASAAQTDRVLTMIRDDASGVAAAQPKAVRRQPKPAFRLGSLFARTGA